MNRLAQFLSSKSVLLRAILIIIVCAVIGLLVNAFHPLKVKIGMQRPDSSSTSRSVEAEGGEEERVEITRIDRSQLKSLLAEQNIVLLDARLPEVYTAGHIPEAINIPWDMLGEYYSALNSIPRDIGIITYCDGPPCETAEQLALEMKKMGFKRVLYYYDGLDDWKIAREEIRKGNDHSD